jgi:uncharacterized membrane protein
MVVLGMEGTKAVMDGRFQDNTAAISMQRNDTVMMEWFAMVGGCYGAAVFAIIILSFIYTCIGLMLKK